MENCRFWKASLIESDRNWIRIIQDRINATTTSQQKGYKMEGRDIPVPITSTYIASIQELRVRQLVQERDRLRSTTSRRRRSVRFAKTQEDRDRFSAEVVAFEAMLQVINDEIDKR